MMEGSVSRRCSNSQSRKASTLVATHRQTGTRSFLYEATDEGNPPQGGLSTVKNCEPPILELAIEGYFDKTVDQTLDSTPDVTSVKDKNVCAVREIPAMIGTAYAAGETLMMRHADTLYTACEMTCDTGHICVKHGPDRDIRGASALPDEQLLDTVTGADDVPEKKEGNIDKPDITGVGDQGTTPGHVLNEMDDHTLSFTLPVYCPVCCSVKACKDGISLHSCFDGKIQAIAEHEDGKFACTDITATLVQYSLEASCEQTESDSSEPATKLESLEGPPDDKMKSPTNLIGCPATGGFQGDLGSMGCKTTADIHGGTVCYGGGVPLGKDFIKADCLVVHVVCHAVKNAAVVGPVDKRETQSVHVTGAVCLALTYAEIPGMGKALNEKTAESTEKNPDSCLVGTTVTSDPQCLTHKQIVVHGYPGCNDSDSFREKIDKVDMSCKEVGPQEVA